MATKPNNKVALFELDGRDPFEEILIRMVETHRAKRADYAAAEDPLRNFDYVSEATMGMVSPRQYADIMVTMKNGRIMNLADSEPENEALADTYLDRAVYAVLALELLEREATDL